MRLVVDTNIIISALIRDSLTRKALPYPYFEFFAPEGINIESTPESLADWQSISSRLFQTTRSIQGTSINRLSTIIVP